jgi:hypothetical protein
MSYYNNGGGPTSSGGGTVNIASGSIVQAEQVGIWNVALTAGAVVAATQQGSWSVSFIAGATLAATQSGGWTVSLSPNQDVNALPTAATDGGANPFAIVSLATTNPGLVKSTPGNLYGFILSNTSTIAWAWVKLYDTTTAPVPGTDTPVAVFGLPPAQTIAKSFPVGLSFATGIGVAMTANPAPTDTTAILAGQVVGMLETA